MPAVDPKRLKFQIEELLIFFDLPEKFHQRLQDLFNQYANRHLHFGDSSSTRPLIPIYNLPRPVARQLNLELSRRCEMQLEAALALADELWKDSYLEIKQTAIHILGAAPISEPALILSRITEWISPNLDKTLISQLFSTGAQQLRGDFQEEWERFIASFLEKEKPKMIGLGIKGLLEGSKDPDFINLPAVFRLISPLIRNPHPAIQQELIQLVSRLVQRSPTETAFFLKQTLAISDSSATAQLIKDCLNEFPENLRRDMKASLKK
jgi:hypothetical protein